MTLFGLMLIFTVSKAATDRYRLMFNNDPATEITVGWEQVSGTDASVYYGTTDHGTDWESYPLTMSPYRSTVYQGMDNQFAILEDLTPNTIYYFVIKDSEGTSDRYWFKTCPDDSSEKLSFVSGGDSRSGVTQRQNSNKMVAKLRPHAVLFGGDLVNTPGDVSTQQWFDDWQLTITEDGQMIPLVHSFGNHEAYGTGGPEYISDLFDCVYDVYYKVTFGGNLFSVYTLNGELLPGHTIPNAPKREAQTAWLETTLLADDAIWKSAQYHRPIVPHHSSKGEGADEFNDWAQLFYDNDVRLVMESDAHVTKLTKEVRPANPTALGGSGEWFTDEHMEEGKGIRFIGEGAWGTIRVPDDIHPLTIATESMYQFNWITVDACKIEVRTIDTQNPDPITEHTEEDRFSISAELDDQIWKPAALPLGYFEILNCDFPGVGFTMSDDTIFVGSDVIFDDTTTNDPFEWLWDFGDGETSVIADPTHTFSEVGVHTISLTATNEEGSSTGFKTVLVYDTIAPIADFTVNRTEIPMRESVDFIDVSGNMPASWSWDFGDGETSIEQHPTHIYARPGRYTVTLSSTNDYGTGIEIKSAYIIVQSASTLDLSIIDGSDDAEEFGTDGSMYLTSSDLEFCYDGGFEEHQHVGLRFQGINVPQGAYITEAYLHFRADESDDTDVELLIEGELAENSAPYDATTNYDISTRTRTLATAPWLHSEETAWVGGATRATSPELTAVVQEIINQPGWELGNAMSFILTGDGIDDDERVADSYEGGFAPRLVFNWEIVYEDVPEADFSVNNETPTIYEEVSFTDESYGGMLSWTWDFGDGTTSADQHPVHAYDSVGVYTVSLNIVNGLGEDEAIKIAYVEVMNNAELEYRIADNNDDAEEHISTGNIDLTSSDLEICYESDREDSQFVGLRFQGVNIPNGAIVTDAYIEFRADESDDTEVDITVFGENVDNAVAYEEVDFNISSRTRTAASVLWTQTVETPWIGGETMDQTPSLTAIVQEIVDREGWVHGNALAFIIESDGIDEDRRVADSYEGGFPARLVVNWELISPIANMRTLNDSICVGESIDFINESENDPTYYNWNFGDGETSEEEAPSHVFATAGVYNVTLAIASYRGNDTITFENMITVFDFPELTVSEYLTICEGDEATINVSGADTYDWSEGLGADASQTISPMVTTTYEVVGTVNGCSTEGEVTVTVNELPVVTMAPFADDVVCLGFGIIELPTSTPSGGTYSGAGVSGGIFNPDAAGTGIHAISYSYTDEDGCSNMDEQTITVDDCLGIDELGLRIFNIYPNPATAIITIERENPSEFSQIKIYGIAGEIVFNKNIADNPVSISIDEWARGTYIVELTNNDNQKIQKRIVVQ